MEGAGNCAADAATLGVGSNNMAVDGGFQTPQQGRVLRKRK